MSELSISKHFEQTETVLTIDGLKNQSEQKLELADDPMEAKGLGRAEMTRSETMAYKASNMPISVAWENLSWSITQGNACKKNKKELRILKDLNGYVRPGEMLAIIGGSGAGKSTLLDILSNRKTSGKTTGSVLFNGVPGDEIRGLLRRVTGYVTQEDILKATLTVRETLQFTAELRLDPKLFSKEQRAARVEQVMQDLGIAHRADMRIGNEEKRGLSGGEKKRVAIGVQLVTDPAVMYLDEPTSGLDSYNSLAVIRLMRKLAESGKTVITTIHQPRSTIFELFDRLLVLDKGRTVYMGPARDVSPYFGSLGFNVPPAMNPADYIIDVLLDPDRADMTTKDVSALDFPTAFAQSEKGQQLLEAVNDCKTNYPSLSGLEDARLYATSYLKQFKELAIRHWRNQVRDPSASLVGMVQAMVMAFIIGSIFYQIGYVAPAAVQGRVGVIFFIMINGAFALSMATAAFIEERLLVNRERASGVYSAGPYYWARVMVDSPLQILQIVLYSTVMYWMSGLNPGAQQFFTFLAIVILNALCAASIFNLVGALAPNVMVGNILVPVITVLFFLFAGFFISAEAIPEWWIWLYYISFFRYSYQAMALNEFLGSTFTCAPGFPQCGPLTGEGILQAYGIYEDASWIWQCCLVLLGYIILYRILAYLVLRFLIKERR